MLRRSAMASATPPPPAFAIPPPGALSPGTRIGRYLVLGPLGRGAMGVVYAAYDPELDRKVAIKLIAPSLLDSGRLEEFKVRLSREAQAMARLTHPNVIAVHDAGTFGDQVFVTMDLLAGATTLRDWASAAPRTWREVRALYLEAGKGLVAAHRAGLIHRDFKPDNVLVGADGRVCVTDLGLARPVTADGGVPVPIPAEGGPISVTPPGLTSLTAPVTEAGAVLGTPGYMAPEQLLWPERVGARTDQFGFCAALWEGVYGSRPFSGATLAELARAILDGEPQAPADPAAAPAWLRKVLLRGLSAKLEDRYSSMEELLAELARDPDLRRRRWMLRSAPVLAGVAVLAGAVWFEATRSARLCVGADAEIAPVWDAARQGAVRSAFIATGKPYAADAWTSVNAAMQGFVRGWAAEHTEACRATRVREVQSEQVLDARMLCLQRAKHQANALTDIFAHADDKVVENAARAVSELPAPASCGDVQALLAAVAPPDASKHERVEAIREELGAARALFSSGKDAEALERAKAAAAEAERVQYPPLVAETLLLRGQLERRQLPDLHLADETLDQAVIAAEQGRDVRTAAAAWTERVSLLGARLGRPSDGLRAAAHARALLGADGTPAANVELLSQEAEVLASAGKYTEALSRYRQTLALAQTAFPADSPRVAAARSNLGYAYLKVGDYDQALSLQEQALGALEKSFGARHPRLIPAVTRIGNVFLRRGLPEQALPSHRRALSIAEGAYPASHPQIAIASTNVGWDLMLLERFDEALPFLRRALAIDEGLYGLENAQLVEDLSPLAECNRRLGALPRAREEAQRAIALLHRSLGPDPVREAPLQVLLARIDRAELHPDRALARAQRALALEERELGKDSPELAQDLAELGFAQLQLHRPALAIDPLQRAVALYEKGKAAGDQIGRAELALAQALWASPATRARSVEAARRARERFARFGKSAAPDQVRADGWLAAHRSP